jgi:hypothetical protein
VSRRLAEVADELYALPLADFTAERNRLAREVKAGGDRDLAATIAELPKPSVSAWVANVLARREPDELGQLLELGEAMREAQQDLDRDELRQLTARRNQAVAALARRARALADELGRSVSGAVADEVEQTLGAAMADPSAGVALRSGRLLRALDAAGFGGVDLDGAVAVPEALPAAPAAGAPTRGRRARAGSEPARRPAPEDTKEAKRKAEQREAAQRALETAEREAERAQRTADEAQQQADVLDAERDAAHDRVTALETQLRTARERLESLETDARSAREARDRTRRAAQAARREAERSRARLDSHP